MSKTYSTLFPQVIREIEKRSGKTVVTSGSRFSVQPSGEGGSLDSRALAEVITGIASDIADLIEPRIISGFDVTATTPPSATINISLGTGTSNGKKWEITADSTLIIPFDSTTYVFYITVYNNAFEISRSHDDTKCEICRIIVPQPGTTSAIEDDKPSDSYNGYIVSAKDAVYDEDQEFDDASVEKLRDIIGPILADNLIGNIRLSENLKITNTQGTLELDSKEIRILNINSIAIAKFNRNGTFFYNDLGIEIAKFSTIEARIGNIKILTNALQSGDYASGTTGFKISDSGVVDFLSGTIGGITIANNALRSSNFVSGTLGSGFEVVSDGSAEFQNIKARGRISTSVFEKETISAIGGNLMVINSDILSADMTANDNSILTISGDSSFSINDILRIKDGTDDEWFKVTAISTNNYTVTRDMSNGYTSDNNPEWKKGTAVVSYGQSSNGGIFMTASESNAPYIDFFTHSGSPWGSIAIKTRIGNLIGVPGCTGYGLYGGSGYLGNLQVIDIINIGSSGSIRSNLTGSYPYLEFSQQGLQLKDNSPGGTYSNAVYSTDKYGFGALAWILNSTIKVPFAVLKEPNAGASDVADLRLYNRTDDPGGSAEIGDLCVVNGKLKICTSAGTPGTWTVVGAQVA